MATQTTKKTCDRPPMTTPEWLIWAMMIGIMVAVTATLMPEIRRRTKEQVELRHQQEEAAKAPTGPKQ